jgi:hypothetical protein
LSTIAVDLRDDYIARVVRGKSFADVGGLWGTINEKVSVAAQSHAAKLAMIDISPAGGDLWRQFGERMSSLDVTGCECISSDVCVLAATGAAPQYDVVHCSGVLYHHPNPVSLLEALRRITGQYLILTSAVTQEHILNELGSYDVPPSGVIFVPALNQGERDILWKFWRENAGAGGCYGISEPVKWDSRDFGPWWWLPTARAMLALAECVGFRVVESGATWNGNAHTALLQVAS